MDKYDGKYPHPDDWNELINDFENVWKGICLYDEKNLSQDAIDLRRRLLSIIEPDNQGSEDSCDQFTDYEELKHVPLEKAYKDMVLISKKKYHQLLHGTSEDRKRLDWLEKHSLWTSPINSTDRVLMIGPLTDIYNMLEEFTIRQAIDKAMVEENVKPITETCLSCGKEVPKRQTCQGC